MRKDVVTICPDETLLTAAKMMAEKNVSSVIIVENSVIKGILTETDMVKEVATENGPPEELKVSQIMSSPSRNPEG